MKEQLKKIKGVPPILVFNPLKRLIAIYASMSSVAKALDTSTTNVLYACNGKSVSCRGLYFRTLDNNIEVTMEDLNELRLEEYDKMCGVSRVYYETKDMSRTGKLTKKKNK